jgi:phytoene desaturase
VVVIGAGLAGLSAAMHLAGAGRRVTVLEAESTCGGSAARVSLPAPGGGAYRLDTGPTVLTMPDLLADCFAALGESMSDWVTLRRLDPAYRAQFADGTGLSVTSDVEEMAERIHAFCGSGESGGNGGHNRSNGSADADGYRRYVEFVTRLYRLQMRSFIDRNFDSPVDLVGSSLAKLVALRGFSRLGPTVARYFRDERLQRVFSFQALYAGVSPARALAIYAVISYMDLVEGVYYPVGGMNALPTAMEAAARKAGVEFLYDTRVVSTTWSGDRVIETQSLDGRTWRPDAVVMTLDRPAALQILDRERGRRRTGRVARTRYSPSCVVLAAGVKAVWPDAAHHTMHFGRAWAEVFDDLETGRLMRDPSFLVSLPSVTDPALAPAGSSAAYLLFPVPNLDHSQPLDWARLRGPYREYMLSTVENAGYRGFCGAIEAELLITPADWAQRGLGAGTPFAAAHTFGQTGPFRSRNTLAENVVFAGSSTTPGVGVPMVLISGRLAAERLTGHNPAYRSLAWR